MKRHALVVCNLGLFVAACALLGTGLLMEYRLEDETAIAGISEHDWREIHFALALTCTGLAVVHVLLNQAWIVGQLKHGRTVAIVLPILCAALIVGGLLSLPSSTKSRHTQQQRQTHEDHDD